MKYRNSRFGSYITAMLLLFCSTSVPATVDSDDLSGFIEQGMELWQVPGMSVAVVSSDEVLFQQSFGESAVEDGRKIDEHTLFAIASTTKAMVVSGILMLVDEKKLMLDDPIVKYIPELHFSDPMLTEQLMVRDLLAHRTGLPSTDFWSFFQKIPVGEQVRRLEFVPATAPVRTRLIYQNTMFELAGLLIERLSGQRWDQFLKQRLWQPIGMKETFGARGEIDDSLVHVMPYHVRGNELVLAKWDILEGLAEAAGSVWSSIHDMSLWAQFLLRDGVTADGKRLISKAGMAEMFEPQQLASPEDFYPTVMLTQPNWRSYGLAWFQQDFQGRKIDFHTGSLSGLIAIIGLDRAENRAVVVLGNRDHAEMRHAVLWEVMDNSPPDERRDWNREIFELYASLSKQRDEQWAKTESERIQGTTTSLGQDQYTGVYESPGFGAMSIENSGGVWTLKTKAVDFEMSHWHLDTFLVEYEDWDLREFAEFRIGPDGSISSIELFDQSFHPVSQ